LNIPSDSLINHLTRQQYLNSADTQQIAHTVAEMYEPSLEVKVICRHGASGDGPFQKMIHRLSSGKTVDGFDKNEAKAVQKALKPFGRLKAIDLVNREVKARRNYTYRFTFEDSVLFFTIELGAGKLESAHILDSRAWTGGAKKALVRRALMDRQQHVPRDCATRADPAG
jgi:hypothetical protein